MTSFEKEALNKTPTQRQQHADDEHSATDSTAKDIGAQQEPRHDDEKHDDKDPDEPDVEASRQLPTDHSNAVASEDFSVFTIPQKRAIIVAGSFIGWFSPMTGSIYFPALNQVL